VLTCQFDQADHTSVVKALYDYEASAPGELSVKEDDVLLAFDQEDDWLLVQSEKDGKAGFVPANYVEVRPCCILFTSIYLLPLI
jgi:actin cytoskeleton-regulatory complex protein SLA1